MKWSQAICASILIDGLFPVPSTNGPKPRFAPALLVTPLEPLLPALLTPDWGLAAGTVVLSAPAEDGGSNAPTAST
jgi:hypothetical protein